MTTYHEPEPDESKRWAAVWAHYPLPTWSSLEIDPVDSGQGFSGGQVWKVQAADHAWALRRWTAGMDSRRLTWMHGVLRSCLAGDARIAQPLATIGGESFVVDGAKLWQVEPWLPGTADFWSNAGPSRLRAALETLAQLHRQLEALHEPRVQPIPAVIRRIELLRAHLRNIDAYLAHVRNRGSLISGDWGAAICRYASQFGHVWLGRLERIRHQTAPTIPVFRDVWHDHVLFMDDHVSGIVDYGGLAIDCPTTDIARLLGSLVEDDRASRTEALHAYQQVRWLPADSLERIDLLDRSGVLIGLLNWVRWLWIERRDFGDSERLQRHVARLTARLNNSDFQI